MSVEKFTVTKEDSCYTTLPNIVLQNLPDLEALGLWCYFQSKPPTWDFYKNEIRKIFDIGIHKLENLCRILKNHNLIEIKHQRNDKGCFDLWHLHVKNGSEFKPLSKNCSTEKTSRKHRAPENRATVNSTYKRKTDKEKKKEKKEREKKLSQDFFPSEETFQFLNSNNVDQDTARNSFNKFMLYHKNSEKKSRDWQNEFKIWILRELKYKKKANI